MGLVRQVVEALGITVIEAPGFEADDIIATLATEAEAGATTSSIVTGDRDSYQLVEDPLIKVLYNRRGVTDYALYDEAGIKERTGVTPAQYAEYAALRGDPVRQPARRARRGGEDGGQADQHLRRPRRHLRQRRRADAEAASVSLAEHEAQVRQNADVMVLRRDVPIDVRLRRARRSTRTRRRSSACSTSSSSARCSTACRRRSAGSAWTRVAVAASDAEVLHPERRRFETASDAVAALAALEVASVAGAWRGDPGRSDLLGIAVVTDARHREVAWLPASLLDDETVADAVAGFRAVRGNDIKPLLRSLLALGDRPGRPAARHRDRRLPARSGADLATRSPTCWSATRASASPTATRSRPASSTSAAAARTRPCAPPGRRSPCRASRTRCSPRSTRRACARCTTTIENPLVRVLARMEDVGVAVDVDELRVLHERLTTEVQAPRPRCCTTSSAGRSTSTRRSSCARSCSTSGA